MSTCEYREFSEAVAYFTFTPEEENRGKNNLIEMGLTSNDWFVSFHARDSAYLAEPTNSQGLDYSYHDFRDSHIENCYKGMETVVNRGGFALRSGSRVIQPLPKNRNNKIIDYADEYSSDFMDIYVNAKCKFFIGNTSGLVHIPKAFGVPYAMANLISYLHMSPQPNSLFIPKLIRDTKSGKLIPFTEIKKLGLFDFETGAYRTEFYKNNGLELVENTADEIADLVEDMFDLTGGHKINSTLKEQQRLFKDIYYSEYPDRHDAGNLAPSFIQRHQIILF
jgi:putative glycosyltransferase (TIGR04372 family)